MTINIWSFEEVEDIYDLLHSSAIISSTIPTRKLTPCSISPRPRKTTKYKAIMMSTRNAQQGLLHLFLWSLDIYSGSAACANIFIAPYYTSPQEWELRR